MKNVPVHKSVRWLVAIALAGIGYSLWSLIRIFPWDAATPEEVEAARHQVIQTDKLNALLVNAALDRTSLKVRYDGQYMPITYPNGDVPSSIGVCTDEVVRCYRTLGIDLQRLVHEDLRAHFSEYPSLWGLTEPDTNIDHRRVPNLQKFLSRQGASLPVSSDPNDYQPGDLVTYMFSGNRPHIAIVVPAPTAGQCPWIMHNRGFGPKMENQLFKWQPTGHYRWRPQGPITPATPPVSVP